MKSKTYLIHNIGVLFVLLFLPFAGNATSKDSPALKIAVITDIHFLDSTLVSEGEALSAYEGATGRVVPDLHAVLDVVWRDLMNEPPDLLLVAGDITNHGERASHLGMIQRLNRLRDLGMRICVVPGNHDINIPDTKSYHGKSASSVPTITKKDFEVLYANFGYADALRRDTASLSYLTEISKSVWLLGLDTNRYMEHTSTSITGGRILPATMDWALGILREAREKGITVLGMMHHGLVEHLPYQAAFFPGYLLDGWEQQSERLADAGLKVVFTGHFHANDVTMRTSLQGNTIYDVETASLSQYPFAYRIMALEKGILSIDTRFVDSVPGNLNLAAVYRDKLGDITRRVAIRKLESLGVPLSEEVRKALIDVIVQLNLLHVCGDEKPDREMMEFIRVFATMLGDEADLDSFLFDFPPQDNTLQIPLDAKGN